VPGKQVEVISCLRDWAVVAIRCSRTRLVDCFHRNWAVENTVRVASVGLRLHGKTNALPALEEVVCVVAEYSQHRLSLGAARPVTHHG